MHWYHYQRDLPRQKNAVPLRFRGFRKYRENCASAASFFLSKSEDSRGSSDLVFIAGSDFADLAGVQNGLNSAPKTNSEDPRESSELERKNNTIGRPDAVLRRPVTLW